jgi:hypothetical protein
VLALVPVMLVDRAVPVSAARVRQVPAHRPLEEALAACHTKRNRRCVKISMAKLPTVKFLTSQLLTNKMSIVKMPTYKL